MHTKDLIHRKENRIEQSMSVNSIVNEAIKTISIFLRNAK